MQTKFMQPKEYIYNLKIFCSSSSYERASTPGQTQTGLGQGFTVFFFYPKLLYCLDQMLVVMLLSQDRVSLSKTVRPRAPCGARCMQHVIRTWFAVCSKMSHLQFVEEARPHLCMNQWNRLTAGYCT